MNKKGENDINLNNVDVVVLCGGRGTRISPVIGDKPKILADINGRPFLEILIGQLVFHGFKNIILSVGYLKDQIKDYAEKSGLEKAKHCKIYFSDEESPLGTGGAIKNAEKLVKSENFLVINGDTFFDADFKKFHKYHLTKNALASMIATQIEDMSDCGNIELDESGKIISFGEKNLKGSGLVSAGIYLMSKNIFNFMPVNASFSLEHDFFPKMIKNNFYGFACDGNLIDIGTPERYEKAKNILNKL